MFKNSVFIWFFAIAAAAACVVSACSKDRAEGAVTDDPRTDVDPKGVAFTTRAPGAYDVGQGDAAFDSFRFWSYDETEGGWWQYGTAVRGGDVYMPFALGDVSWPFSYAGGTAISHRMTFYALATVGGDPGASDPECLMNAGSLEVTVPFNHGMTDYLAACTPDRGITQVVSLDFRHVMSKINRVMFDLSAFNRWIAEEGFSCVSDVVVTDLWISEPLSVASEFAEDAGTPLPGLTGDYSSGSGRGRLWYMESGTLRCIGPAGAETSLNLASGGRVFDGIHSGDGGMHSGEGYMAFPGTHTISVTLQAYDTSRNALLGASGFTLTGTFDLPQGFVCDLDIFLTPKEAMVTTKVNPSMAGWMGFRNINEEF